MGPVPLGPATDSSPLKFHLEMAVGYYVGFRECRTSLSHSKAAPHMSLPMRGSMGSQTKGGKEGSWNWILLKL